MTFIENKISHILSSSTGVKCLLFDSITKDILSTFIPHSRFLDNNFFLFEDIDTRRPKISLNCVCVLSPQSIKSAIKEVTDPSYISYTLLFTNSIDLSLLNLLAKNDTHGVIQEVHEIYMDYSRQDDKLYLLTNTNSINSFIYTLGYRPTIYFYKGDKDDTVLEKIKADTYGHMQQGGRLFVIDREYDKITPLIIDWHYQSMIKRYCQYENCLVRLNNKTLCMDDNFFYDNKFCTINEVESNLEKLIKSLDMKKKIKRLDITEIEEINKMNEVATKHAQIYKHLVQDIEEKIRVSEAENRILVYKKKHRITDTQVEMSHLHEISMSDTKYEIKKDEDIKLSYVPPIRRMMKDILRNKLGGWTSIKEYFNKQIYLVLYFVGGVTYTEYRHIMEVCGEMEHLYIVTDKIL